MSGDWLKMTAADLGRGIGAGRIHALELTEAFLDAIARHPDRDAIYARVTPRRARSMAMAAADRARAGVRIGLLDGVPLSWKDLFDASDAPTEAGSQLLKGRVPRQDAEVLASATAGGTVCLGKTHMTELAFSGLGINPMTATPPNRVIPGAAPGGSSSGAAASITHHLAPAAIGSDTGGSVRIPAAWNDLVGLKTTHGRLSLRGVVPLCASFDTVGPLARTVEDCAEVLAVLEGGRAPDLRGASLRGARLLVLEGAALDGLRELPAAGFEAAVDRLARAGAVIERQAVPAADQALALSPLLFAPEAYAQWREVIEAAPDRMYPVILERFRSGASVLAAEHIAAWQRLHRLRTEWQAAVAGFDAVLLPTSPILPPDAARLVSDPDYFASENLMALRNTRIGNVLGLCALTLPTGEPACGITLMGGPMAEERLLRLGAAAERALA